MLLVCAQALSARIFWGIPDPSMEMAHLSEMPDASAKVAAVLNRLLVIDNFHGNLWSHFGSRPVHAVLLVLYGLFSLLLMWWLGRAAGPHRIQTRDA
jgi:hypothetical protein